ncbi:MAG: hypothetical protein NDI61_03195 [Bdellovibrionaceae bacterium]|nr:hypothetical protein [Pseudobdellovibrionaceae bacterium]
MSTNLSSGGEQEPVPAPPITEEPGLPSDPETPVDPGKTENPPPPPVVDPIGQLICSRLDFQNVVWPSHLVELERKALALSLNISGSFEGHRGWANISNNFDDQGMSLGLLQQNFGQGSLQPLLTEMFDQHLDVLRGLFTRTQLASMDQMLADWSGGTLHPLGHSGRATPLFPDQEHLSPLDFDDAPETEPGVIAMNTSANQRSVAWAVDTLFQDAGVTFIPAWKTAFQNLAVTAPYRSLQIRAALTMFDRAAGYTQTFRFTQMRSFLTMYDFVVQNGGFNATHRALFETYDKENPGATETQRLLKLLEIRLTSVRPQYKNDVRARKSTIIRGTGVVHGANRNLPSEYCFDPSERVR